MNPRALTRRAAEGGTADPIVAPVRIVHLGLGAFHRAHQAFFTAHASDAKDWGIAAFTGRNPLQADLLEAQEGLYCLVERGPVSDHVEVITSIVEAIDGTRVDRLAELLSSSHISVVTLTITEAGYRLSPDGGANMEDPVVSEDLEALRLAWAGENLCEAAPQAALTRLLVGLETRRRAGGDPIAIVPCDNLPNNGGMTARVLRELAKQLDEGLANWIEEAVSFVSTSVDRITPRAEDGLTGVVADAGWVDKAPVVAEPFRDWVLAGEFPLGCPDWESAGARFVDDIEPWENRKLWLLNGAHSLLAYAGIVAGHGTVAQAVADPWCRELVDDYWREAAAHIPDHVETNHYRRALIDRFTNERIEHHLDQIAAEGSSKVRFRFASVAERDVARGRNAEASAVGIGMWIRWVLNGRSAPDGAWAEVQSAASQNDPVSALTNLVSPVLATNKNFLKKVRSTAMMPASIAASD